MIEIDVEASTPEEAIAIGGKLLLNNNYIEESYIEAMIKAYKELGSYIVIAPGIAMPHAAPRKGVIKTGVSFIRLKKGVEFNHPTNDPVRIVFCLAGEDEVGHIEILRRLSKVLSDSENISGLLSATKAEQVLEVLNS